MSADPASPASPASSPVSSAPSGAFGTWTIRLLALIGVLGCLALIAIVILIGGISMGGRQPAKVEAADSHEVFSVGGVDRITGSNLVRMDIWANRGGNPYSSGGSRDDRRNVLLIDTTNGTSRRLLPDNKRQIEEFHLLPGSDDSDDAAMVADAVGGETKDGRVPTWYYLLAVRADQTGYDLILGPLASAQQATVLTAIDGVDSTWMLDPTHLALIVREKRKLSYRVIDMTRFKVTASHPIAID